MKKIILIVSLLAFGCFSVPASGFINNNYQIENNEYEVLGRVTARAEVFRFALLIRFGPGDIFNRAMMELSDKAGVYGENVGLINVSIDYWFDSFALVFGKDVVSVSADVIRHK